MWVKGWCLLALGLDLPGRWRVKGWCVLALGLDLARGCGLAVGLDLAQLNNLQLDLLGGCGLGPCTVSFFLVA